MADCPNNANKEADPAMQQLDKKTPTEGVTAPPAKKEGFVRIRYTIPYLLSLDPTHGSYADNGSANERRQSMAWGSSTAKRN